MVRHLLPLFVSAAILVSCGNESPKPDSQPAEPKPAAGPVGDAERDAWMMPGEIITLMGGDLKGYVVADLFAGDGYFTSKLLAAGANVIAIENDPAKVAKLENLKKELGLGDDRLRIRLVPAGDPGLAPEEADVALIVHHYVGIPDKATYFNLLRRGLRAPRWLFIQEWLAKETPIGPPMAARMGTEALMDEVGMMGYHEVGAYSAKVPHQVIYFASDPTDESWGEE